MNCVFCNYKMRAYPVGVHGYQKISCPNCKTTIFRSPAAIAMTENGLNLKEFIKHADENDRLALLKVNYTVASKV